MILSAAALWQWEALRGAETNLDAPPSVRERSTLGEGETSRIANAAASTSRELALPGADITCAEIPPGR